MVKNQRLYIFILCFFITLIQDTKGIQNSRYTCLLIACFDHKNIQSCLRYQIHGFDERDFLILLILLFSQDDTVIMLRLKLNNRKTFSKRRYIKFVTH